MLPRAVVVERPEDDDRQVVRDRIGVCEPIGSRLRRRVGAARVERVLLVHRRRLGRAVHLARRDEDEPLDRRLPNGVEEDLRALDVRRHELGGAFTYRLLDVRLGCGVHDHVHAGHDVTHEIGVADVALNERQPLVRHDVGEVLEIARVRQRVERHDLVRRRSEQMADDVRRDEPRTARDENALAHSSRSIVYRGRPSTSRWILPRYSPTSARMKPWMPRTNTIAAPPNSGPGKSSSPIQYATPYRPSAKAASEQTTPSVTPIHWIGCGQKPASTWSPVRVSRSGE